MLVRILNVTENVLGEQAGKEKEIWGDLVDLMVLRRFTQLKRCDGTRDAITIIPSVLTINGSKITLETSKSIYRLEVVNEI